MQNETRALFLTIYKNQVKMDQIPKYKTWNYEITYKKTEGEHFKLLVEVTIFLKIRFQWYKEDK
jgi:hypothetical protein